jgi:hypothetical protein
LSNVSLYNIVAKRLVVTGGALLFAAEPSIARNKPRAFFVLVEQESCALTIAFLTEEIDTQGFVFLFEGGCGRIFQCNEKRAF